MENDSTPTVNMVCENKESEGRENEVRDNLVKDFYWMDVRSEPTSKTKDPFVRGRVLSSRSRLTYFLIKTFQTVETNNSEE